MFAIQDAIRVELDRITAEGRYKQERAINTPQGPRIGVGGSELLNFCANNYLGLADDPYVVEEAQRALKQWGFGMASVRFVCGTQEQHLELERELSDFLGTDATILYSSCFDANGGIFEALLDEQDAVISDELNHASIIDGIRLCKAKRYRYHNRDLADLEKQLKAAQGSRRCLIVTDGVFSMDGSVAPLAAICELSEKYGALVMVDDSHGVGVLGPTGAGTAEAAGVQDRVDILTGTLGKALGGAAGGYVSGRQDIVELLRQRSRPYLFSNALPPSIVAGSKAALRRARESQDLRTQLRRNTSLFRRLMAAEGFTLLDGDHPIVPVMLGDDNVAETMALHLREQGVHVTAFTYPVVPRKQARIRIQLSARHSEQDIQTCVGAFVNGRRSVDLNE